MFSFLRKTACILIALMILVMPVQAYGDASTGKSLDITATGAVVLDLDTDTILYKRSMNTQCRPASLTKMMTLLVAYEQTLGRHDELVSLTREMIDVPSESSSANLKNGDLISIYDLFYAMMLPSGNDAAKALAYIVSGSEESFALLMNEKALALGMTKSNFKNAHGFDADGHYTTPYDLCLLAEALCENEELVKIFSSYKYTVTVYSNGDTSTPATQTYYNSNIMLNPNSGAYFDGLMGIKTGYTDLAGNCLASYYEKDGRRLVAIITHSNHTQRDPDTRTVIKYGLEAFDTFNLREVFSSKRIVVDLENADDADESNGQLELYLQHPAEDTFITVSKAEGTKIRTFDENTVSIRYPVLQAPVTAGESVGTVEFVYNNEVLYSCTALASRTVDAQIESPADLVSLGIKGKTRISLDFLTDKYFLIPAVAVVSLVILVFAGIYLRKRQASRVRARQKNGVARRRRRRGSRPGNGRML